MTRWTRGAARMSAAAMAGALLLGAPLRAQEEEGEPQAGPVLSSTDAWVAAGFAAGTILVRPADRDQRVIRRYALGDVELLQRLGKLLLAHQVFGFSTCGDSGSRQDLLQPLSCHDSSALPDSASRASGVSSSADSPGSSLLRSARGSIRSETR